MRELSCHCERCLRQDYHLCDNTDAGEWEEVKVVETKSSHKPATLRSIKGRLDKQRRKMAKEAKLDQIIDVESADDAEGFSWWLALVTLVAFQYDGPITEHGVKLKKGQWYLTVMFYDRSPPTSEDQFRLNGLYEMVMDVEGVVYIGHITLVEARASRSSGRGSVTVTNKSKTCLMKLQEHTRVVPLIETSLKDLSL